MPSARRMRARARRSWLAVAAVMVVGPIAGAVVAPAAPAAATGSATVPIPSAAAPPPRAFPALAKAPGGTETTLLFGGTDSHDVGDTWTYDGVWHEFHGVSPSRRASPAMAYDPALNATVLFGGIEGGIHALADAWIWDGRGWFPLPLDAPAPVGRWGAALAYDSATDHLVLFGGHRFASPSLRDMWQLTGRSWVQLTPPTLPPAIAGDVDMMTNPVAPGLVLFDSTTADTWVWDGTTWTRLDAATAFPQGGAPGPHDVAELAAGRLFSGPTTLSQVRTWTANGWSAPRATADTPTGAPAGGVAETLVAYAGGSLHGAIGSAERDETWVLGADETWQHVTTPFYAIRPIRLLDTRPDSAYLYSGAKPSAGDIVPLSLDWLLIRGGNDDTQVASGGSLVLQLTATEATADGYVTVWPCGPTVPLASNLNVQAGETASTLAITAIGNPRSACIFTQSGTHLVVDVVGYIPRTSGAAGPPVRRLDTRPEWRIGYTGLKPGGGSIVAVPVGAPGHTVALNVTGTKPAADGYVSVVDCQRAAVPPTTSSLNLVRGTIRSNVIVTVTDAAGQVCLYTQSGAHLVVDQLFDFGALALRSSVGRVLDTRPGLLPGGAVPKPAAASTTYVQISGANVPSDATALWVQVTATEATADGFVTAWSCDDADRPIASVLNLTTGGTRSNLVLVPLGPSRLVCLYSQTGTHLVADVVGAL